MRTTITPPEISERLGICEETVYDMVRGQTIPNILYGRRFMISGATYEHWEATIGEAIPPSVAKEPDPSTQAAAQRPRLAPPKAA